MTRRPSVALVVAALAVATVLSQDPRAYTTYGARWSQPTASYVINPANLDLPANAVVSAVQAGADAWALQSAAAFAFTYSGLSSQTSITYDGVNLVLFRDASSPVSAIATTYYWSNGSGLLLDTDIVFWDAGFQFFAGSAGCSNGFYIEDIAVHEFGHALGLDHSTVESATMYPSVLACDSSNRSLDEDDLAGVLAIYGPRPPATPTGLRFVR